MLEVRLRLWREEGIGESILGEFAICFEKESNGISEFIAKTDYALVETMEAMRYGAHVYCAVTT